MQQQAGSPVLIQHPAPVVVATTVSGGRGCYGYGRLCCWGVTEIVFGVLILILGIAAVVMTPVVNFWTTTVFTAGGLALDPDKEGWYNRPEDIPMYAFINTGQGIWCGIVLIVTGILGIPIREDSPRCLYIANMILAIVTSLVTIAAMVISALASIANGYFLLSIPVIALHITILVLSFPAMIIALVHVCACSAGSCSKPGQTQVVYAQQPGVAMTQPLGQHEPTQFTNPAYPDQEYPEKAIPPTYSP